MLPKRKRERDKRRRGAASPPPAGSSSRRRGPGDASETASPHSSVSTDDVHRELVAQRHQADRRVEVLEERLRTEGIREKIDREQLQDKIKKLQSQVDELTLSKAEMHETSVGHETMSRRLKMRNRTLRDQYDVSHRENLQLSREVRDLRRILSKPSSRDATLTRELREQISRLSSEITTLQQDLSTVSNKYESQLESLRQDLEETTSRKIQCLRDSKYAEALHAKAISNLHGTLRTVRKKNDDLLDMVEESNRKCEQYVGEKLRGEEERDQMEIIHRRHVAQRDRQLTEALEKIRVLEGRLESSQTESEGESQSDHRRKQQPPKRTTARDQSRFFEAEDIERLEEQGRTNERSEQLRIRLLQQDEERTVLVKRRGALERSLKTVKGQREDLKKQVSKLQRANELHAENYRRYTRENAKLRRLVNRLKKSGARSSGSLVDKLVREEELEALRLALEQEREENDRLVEERARWKAEGGEGVDSERWSFGAALVAVGSAVGSLATVAMMRMMRKDSEADDE